jgi:hypothetical protein
MDREARIRERAHRIWEEEGCPDGRHQQHWQRACNEIDAETRHAGARSGIPDAPSRSNRSASQSGTGSGLAGADDNDRGVLGTGSEELSAGRLSGPDDNQPSTGRSKLVGG